MDQATIDRLQRKLANYEAKLPTLPSETPAERAYLTSIRQTIAQTRRRLREAHIEPAERKPHMTAKRRLLEKLAYSEGQNQRLRDEIGFLKRTIETLHRAGSRVEA